MSKRMVCAVLVGVAFAMVPSARTADGEEPWVAELLQMPVDFHGFDDPKTTLQEALDHLGKRYGDYFQVNEKAFQADRLRNVNRVEIATPMAVPAMPSRPLGQVLQRILDRLPCRSGAMILVRRNYFEITTVAAARAELLGDDKRPLLPLVHLQVKDQRLSTVLPALLKQTTYNVVLDPRVPEKRLTATLLNAPTDTAVNVLAELAGLQVVRQQNVFYLTTPERAAELRKEATSKPAPK